MNKSRSKLNSKRNSKRNSRRNSRRDSRSSRSSEIIILQKSKNPAKKYAVTIGRKTINFGAKGYSDYTIHKDRSRMRRYETRHRSRETWSKSGVKTAGFWSKWILWNKPSLNASISDTRRRFGLKIINRI